MNNVDIPLSRSAPYQGISGVFSTLSSLSTIAPGTVRFPPPQKFMDKMTIFGACLPMLYCIYQIMLFCRRYRLIRSGWDYNDFIRAGTAQRSDKTWGITSACAPILTRRTDKGGLCIVHGLQRGRSGLYPDLQSLYRQIHEGRQ